MAYGLTFDGYSNGVEKTGGQKFRGDGDARLARGPSLKTICSMEILTFVANSSNPHDYKDMENFDRWSMKIHLRKKIFGNISK